MRSSPSCRWLRRREATWVAFLILSGAHAPLGAQTRFAPTRNVDITQYTTLESCMALMSRLEDSIERKDSMSTVLDTFPIAFVDAWKRKQLPPALLNIARQCAVPFQSDQIVPQDLRLALRLFLRAGRDADVEQLTSRIMAEQAPFKGTPQDQGRTETIREVVELYTETRPARYSAALRFVMLELQSSSVVLDQRVILLSTAASIAMTMGDTTRANELTDLALADYRRLFAQSGGQVGRNVQQIVRERLAKRNQRELLDSLGRSTSAYLNLLRSDGRFRRVANTSQSAFADVGDRVPVIHGEFWFTPNAVASTHNLVRPSPGKTSMIAFLSQSCFGSEYRGEWRNERVRHPVRCFGAYAALRRLMQRFPNVELTVVAQTRGYVWPTGPVPPAEEAEMFRQWWLGFHKLPATLTVSTTKFFRLESPDRRRIDEETVNETAYNTRTLSLVVADRNGVIVEQLDALTRAEEPWIDELLRVLER